MSSSVPASQKISVQANRFFFALALVMVCQFKKEIYMKIFLNFLKSISLLLQNYMVSDNKVVYKFIEGQLDPLLFTWHCENMKVKQIILQQTHKIDEFDSVSRNGIIHME